MTNGWIEDRGSQRSPRNFRIKPLKGNPHTDHMRRQIVTRYHSEVKISVIPWVNEMRTLITWVATPFLLHRTFRFRMGSFFTPLGLNEWVINDNFFLYGRKNPYSFLVTWWVDYVIKMMGEGI